jgi:GT2 family glycosyltransferase
MGGVPDAPGSEPRDQTPVDAPAMAISIVIACYNAHQTISDCLSSLAAQTGGPPFEVIVVDSSNDGTAEVVKRDFPAVRLVELAERVHPGNARNRGVAVARGSILAFTDADCTVAPDWVHAIAKAHERDAPMIGGVIDNRDRNSLRSWAYYFCDLTPWMPGTPAGDITDIATGCMTLKRWAWEACGPFLENVYGSDTALSWKLRQRGHQPFFDPTIKVEHRYALDLGGFLRRELVRGRTFGALRAREQDFSGVQRWLGAASAPAAALRMLQRKIRTVWRAGMYQRELVLCSPLLAIGIGAWYLGQAAGYLDRGSGRAPATESRAP